MTVCVDNLKKKKSSEKLLELISEFNKVTGCKINIQILFVFLYTSHEHMSTENKDKISFAIIKKREIPSINLTKHVQGLYAKSHIQRKKS